MSESAKRYQPDIAVRWLQDDFVTAQSGDSFLNAGYNAGNGTMYLTDMYVPPTERRQGRGSALVAAMRAVLEHQGGRRMVGDITSKPCVDVMRKVLGEQAVAAMIEMDYAPDDPAFIPPAVARLEYTLPVQSPPAVLT